MSINAAAIADAWNAPIPEINGTPLSKEERNYTQLRTYRFHIELKTGNPRVLEFEGERSIDAWLALFADLDKRGLEPVHIDIEDLMGKFE